MTDLVDSPDVFGSSIFCDDIRYEIDGKTNFIGAYSGTLFSAQFPAVLPKFGIGVSFSQRRKVFSPVVELRVFMPGDPDDKPSIVGGMPQTIEISKLPPIEPMSEYVVMYANIIFAPFTINEAGLMKVRVLREDRLYRLGTLRIAQMPSPQEATSSSAP
jgi:hypothetical protein